MMVWMIFAAAVAALAGAAALAAERALRLLRLPTRGAWMVALAASLALPLVLPRPAVVDGGAPAAGAIQPSRAVEAAPARGADQGLEMLSVAPSIGSRVEAALPWAWGASTLAIGAALAVAALRLARRRRAWPVETVAGERVLVSPGVGPAVVGFVRPRIVMPRWALAWAEPLQRLILRHEREHVRAGDPLLLLAGLVSVTLMPWNPAVWWQLRRLRLAMEVDCDARTLRHAGDVLEYGRLLLEIGRLGGAGAPLPLVAFSEPRSFLERRIDAMTMRVPPHRRRLVLAWAGVAGVAGVAAVSLAALPAPAGVPFLPVRAAAKPAVSAALAPAVVARPAAPVAQPAAAAEPTPSATPAAAQAVARQDTSRVWQLSEVDRHPSVTNSDAMARLLDRTYPPLLRDAGIRGLAVVDLVVGTDGTPQNATVTSSNHEAFSVTALTVANAARFRPATREGRPVRVRIQLPVAMHSMRSSVGDQPIGTAYDTESARRNRQAMVRQLLATHYPRVAETGTTGREYVWFVVDGRSRVRHSGTGTIEAAQGWSSDELLRQMRQRVPGFGHHGYFFGEFTTAENGPKANVAWFLDFGDVSPRAN